MSGPDVAVIGGGIVGCSAAAFLAEAGAKVELYERDEVGAAASGRNSGSVQHPFDPVMAELHTETLAHYRALPDLDFPEQPAGVLMLASDPGPLEPTVDELRRDCPELEATLLDPAASRAYLDRLRALADAFLAEYEARAPISRERLALWETWDYLRDALHLWTKPKVEGALAVVRLLEYHLTQG